MQYPIIRNGDQAPPVGFLIKDSWHFLSDRFLAVSLTFFKKNKPGLLIKMDIVHNSIFGHFEFVHKGKQKLQKRLFFWKNLRNY